MAGRTAPREGIRPSYELRASKAGAGNLVLEIWQLPSRATPELRQPHYIGGLAGRNLALVEPRVLKQLRAAGVDIGSVRHTPLVRADLHEALALRLGLTFRALAPMRNRTHMRVVSDGVEAMAPEEAAYWLGMAMRRKHPRRVLMALRCLFVEPAGSRA
jgi:hypothetical protein